MSRFIYSKSKKIIHWGCQFDSLLELKFAISIEDEYEFTRSRVSIHYHPGTLKPTDYIRTCIRRYTPDFLIRHKQTGEAFLVEIKPDGFNNEKQLATRKIVAENYIRWKGYDWKYRVIYGCDICLTRHQEIKFKKQRQYSKESARNLAFAKRNQRFDRSAPTLFFSSAEIIQHQFRNVW